jgi:single-strand DNA-binding protein
MQNVNRVIITGNLTRDPELLTGGTAVCKMRVAVNGRRKNNQTGSWEDEPNYFDVTAFGKTAENAHKYLAKGRGIAVDGRLSWREWTTQDGQKRQGVEIIVENLQFLGDGKDGGGGNGAPPADVPIDTGDFQTTAVTAGADDDIPF